MAGAACSTAAPAPTEATAFKGRGSPLSSILAQGAERVSAEQLRALLTPGQTVSSHPEWLPRFKFELHVGGQYSGTSQASDGKSYYSTGTWWIEDSGRYCFMYRGTGAGAPYPNCGFLYALNGRYFSSEKNEPDSPLVMRIFGRPL
jgi:hypothetical protein